MTKAKISVTKECVEALMKEILKCVANNIICTEGKFHVPCSGCGNDAICYRIRKALESYLTGKRDLIVDVDDGRNL